MHENCPPHATDPSVPRLVQCVLSGAAGWQRCGCCCEFTSLAAEIGKSPWRSLQSHITVTLLIAEPAWCGGGDVHKGKICGGQPMKQRSHHQLERCDVGSPFFLPPAVLLGGKWRTLVVEILH